MKLFYFISLIFQNEIIAAPIEEPLGVQEQLTKLESQFQSLIDENKNFKRQIDSLIESKVKLIDKVQQLVVKSTFERDVISSVVVKIQTALETVVNSCEIIINVSSKKKWTERNLSGCYSMIDVVNDRLAYKVSFLITLKLGH